MAKIDSIFKDLGAGLENPGCALYQTMVPVGAMQQIGLRKQPAGLEIYSIWVLTVGEMGKPPLGTFYGHKSSDCIKGALRWKGLPTSKKRKAAPEAATADQAPNA